MTFLTGSDSLIPHALQAIKQALLHPTVSRLFGPRAAGILGSAATRESCEVSTAAAPTEGSCTNMVAKCLVAYALVEASFFFEW